ncbi:MAG: ParB N-terminal domain-containing protein [Pirellulaceae bacterium]
MPIGDLVPDPENARVHNDGNLTAIVASLRKYGQRKPIVVNRRTREIEVGNGTLQAMQHLQREYIAAVLAEDDNATARGFSIADNRSGELATWDLDILLPQIDLLKQEDADLVAELLLDELRTAEDDESGAGGESLDVPTAHQVVVECKNESDQQKVFKEMQGRGYRVRLLTM